MQLDDALWEQLATQLNKIHARNKKTNTGWKLGAWASTTPFSFDYSAYNTKDYDSMWQMNIDLHDAMNDYWAEIEHDTDRLITFASWVVEDWGRIENRTETISNHVSQALQPFLLDGKSGVASYSKILSAKNRKRYFILDTRVALALNVLQLDFPLHDRLYFDVTAGRKGVVSSFNKSNPKNKFKTIGYRVQNKKIYKTYNTIVLKMADVLRTSGIAVEMMLFDNAKQIIASKNLIDGKFDWNIKVLQEKHNEKIQDAQARLENQEYTFKKQV